MCRVCRKIRSVYWRSGELLFIRMWQTVSTWRTSRWVEMEGGKQHSMSNSIRNQSSPLNWVGVVQSCYTFSLVKVWLSSTYVAFQPSAHPPGKTLSWDIVRSCKERRRPTNRHTGYRLCQLLKPPSATRHQISETTTVNITSLSSNTHHIQL